MSAVLEPLLGYELGRERANNIAQVFLFSVDDAVKVAFSMLRGTGVADPLAVAEAVARAWQDGVREMEKVAVGPSVCAGGQSSLTSSGATALG
jgi:hypothetical protein